MGSALVDLTEYMNNDCYNMAEDDMFLRDNGRMPKETNDGC